MRNYFINGKGDLIIAPIGTFESYESIADLFSDLRADFPKLKAIARREISKRKNSYRKNEPPGSYDIIDTNELELSDRDSKRLRVFMIATTFSEKRSYIDISIWMWTAVH